MHTFWVHSGAHPFSFLRPNTKGEIEGQLSFNASIRPPLLLLIHSSSLVPYPGFGIFTSPSMHFSPLLFFNLLLRLLNFHRPSFLFPLCLPSPVLPASHHRLPLSLSSPPACPHSPVLRRVSLCGFQFRACAHRPHHHSEGVLHG